MDTLKNIYTKLLRLFQMVPTDSAYDYPNVY